MEDEDQDTNETSKGNHGLDGNCDGRMKTTALENWDGRLIFIVMHSSENNSDKINHGSEANHEDELDQGVQQNSDDQVDFSSLGHDTFSEEDDQPDHDLKVITKWVISE